MTAHLPSHMRSAGHSTLEREFRGKLQLARIEHGSRLAEGSVGKIRYRDGQQSQRQPGRWRRGGLLRGARHRRTLLLDGEGRRISIVFGYRRTGAAKSGRTVDAIHFTNVRRVEQVEGVGRQIEPYVFGQLEVACQAQIERIQWIANVSVPSNGSAAIRYRSANATEPPDAIRAQARHVAKGIVAGKQSKRTARLQSNDAAELKVAHETMLGSIGGEVCGQVMSHILVGVGTLGSIIELIGWQIDEGREISVVDGVGVRVIGGQVK